MEPGGLADQEPFAAVSVAIASSPSPNYTSRSAPPPSTASKAANGSAVRAARSNGNVQFDFETPFTLETGHYVAVPRPTLSATGADILSRGFRHHWKVG